MAVQDELKRTIVYMPAFERAIVDIYGSADAADAELSLIEFAVQYQPELSGLPTRDPYVRTIRIAPKPHLGRPRVVITFQYDNRRVYFLGAAKAQDSPPLTF